MKTLLEAFPPSSSVLAEKTHDNCKSILKLLQVHLHVSRAWTLVNFIGQNNSGHRSKFNTRVLNVPSVNGRFTRVKHFFLDALGLALLLFLFIFFNTAIPC